MNVADLVDAAAATRPDQPGLQTPGAAPLTWAEIADEVGTVAGWLSEQGIVRGDRVALVHPNSVEFAIAYWAALRCGATVVPANPAYTAPELAHIFTDSAPALVLCHPALADTVGGATNALDVPPAVHVELGRAAARPPAGEPPEVAVVCYTSGTTGHPKGAQLSHDNFLANLASFSELPRLALSAEDVLLGVLPFFHIFGLNVILNAAARIGGCVLVLDRFSPAGSLELMATHGVSIAYGAPPMFAAWAAAAPSTPRPGRLRAAISGADALPAPLWERFRALYDLEVMEGYGLTETAPVLTSTAASPQVRPGTVGHPIPGVSIRVVDPSGADVATGKTGEIVARGPNVFIGYLNAPEATAEACREGWFHTGDLGRLDEDGYLTIAGRLKDMVIVSGFNVYPREVELVLCSHPDVVEAAVVGLPDARTGERVRAVVVARPEAAPSAEELMAHCREQLARYKLPREISFTAALPRTALGKVRRSELRDQGRP